MTRGILIAGNESSLFSAVVKEAARRVTTVAAALIPSSVTSTARGPEAGDGSSQILFKWNAGSPLSARTLLLQAAGRLGQINDAILICSPPALRKRPCDLSPAEIEAAVNNEIKGWFFLVRELCLVFRGQETGSLSMVVNEISPGGKDDIVDIAGPPAQAAFRALAQGVLLSSSGEPYTALGFSTNAAGSEEEFAAHIFKTIDEGNRRDSGKWHKSGMLNLFR